MTDTDVAASGSTSVSKREAIGATGEAVGWTDAVAVRYTALREGHTVVIQWANCTVDLEADADKYLDLRAGFDGDERLQAAISGGLSFGFVTYLGNITNPVRNPPKGKGPLTNDDGSVVTEAQRLNLALDNLANGEWTNQRGEGEGSTALVVEALARIKGYDLEVARAKWRDLADEHRENLKKETLVKRTIQAIRLERMDAKAASAKPEDIGF